jgi:hypothetical protein
MLDRHQTKEIRRFPRHARFPRLAIKDHAELEEIRRRGRGFVFNNRTDRKMLHRANCEALEVMSPRRHQKVFFDDLDKATDWLDQNHAGWELCGRCCSV